MKHLKIYEYRLADLHDTAQGLCLEDRDIAERRITASLLEAIHNDISEITEVTYRSQTDPTTYNPNMTYPGHIVVGQARAVVMRPSDLSELATLLILARRSILTHDCGQALGDLESAISLLRADGEC